MSDPVKPSQTVARQYPTNNGAGSAANWSSDPTLELVRNGTVDVAVTVTHVAASTTGFPGFSFTVPSGYAAGDGLQVRASGSLDGQTPCGIVWVGHVITKRVSELNDAAAGPSAVAIREEIDANSTKLDATITSRLASGSYTAPPTVGAIRTELETNGGLLDQVYDVASAAEAAASAASVSAASVDTKLSTGRLAKVDTLPDTGTVATTDDAMTLQTGERTSIASAVRTDLATELARIDTNINSRSTYTGTDTAGTTTLLARLNSTRAGNLDNLNSPVADLASAVGTLATVLDGMKGEGWTNETLKAIFEKDVEATIGEEQIAEISGEISAALADQGITVAEFTAAALAQLVSVKAISLISPFTAIGDLVLQIGDDYLAADETSLDWSNAAGSWGDLTDCQIEFRSSRVIDQVEQPNAVVTGTVLVASGSGQKVRVELPASWTLQLSPGAYAYQLVRITSAGKERTLRRGSITALRRVGVPS